MESPAPEFGKQLREGLVVTKLYALVALTLGAVWLAPAQAQLYTDEAEWLACAAAFGEEACGPRPGPETPPPPPPEEEPPAEEPPPVEEPPPAPPPASPPPQDPCAKGKHNGHGKHSGQRCSGGDRDDRHSGWERHRAKAKAAWNQFLRWCQSFRSHRGGRD
jgi:hypothetical protein